MSYLKPIKHKIENNSKKLLKEIEKLKMLCCSRGYNKIQPRIYGRGVLTMVRPSIIECECDNSKDHFIPSLGSLKKRQVIDCKARAVA